MPSLRIQMHLHWNPSVLQRDVVSQRVVYAVHPVVLSLQQERRGRLAVDMNIWIRPEIFVRIRRTREDEFPGTLDGVPFRRRKRQMSWINTHGKVRAAAFLVRPVYRRVQALREMRAHRCHHMSA